jgi:hypothetical protein
MPIFFRTFLSSSLNVAKAVPDDWIFETTLPLVIAGIVPRIGGKQKKEDISENRGPILCK